MNLRSFQTAERDDIVALYERAFADSEGPAEGELIASLVKRLMSTIDAGDGFGFLAEEQQRIVGCIILTRLWFDGPVSVFMLSPVAVDTEHQGRGFGQGLIDFGLRRLAESGVEVVFTYGDPTYYSKSGFEPVPQAIAEAPFELSHPEAWLARSLDESVIRPLSGRPRCVEPFNDPGYW